MKTSHVRLQRCAEPRKGPCKGLAAGLDLEIHLNNRVNDSSVIEAVKRGVLSYDVPDRSAKRILKSVFRYTENRNPIAVFDRNTDHEKAVKIEKCIVLLKNESG